MALLDVFKKKKESSAPKAKPAPVKEVKKPVVKKEKKAEVKKEAKAVAPKRIRKVTGEAYRFLKSPHVTEKASDLSARNQYVFRVTKEANKIEVKKAVEEVYKVNVVNVRIVNVPKKAKRLGKTTGWRKGYKKAIVEIAKNQKIEIMPR